ncbi:family 2 glycoside hydrolase [Melampsora larici-populina 98AG31]|uniref:Beta-mannosidase A n=1 Tax=Melampsora larici-populina (strain 98AG31 / pathotype 3-4-7) TaxID=747676 RepID=F4R447_MELLP|nr:family 2 glycoside hydrolase [Melampsora larici-populina 98AG31]EGG12738.1 family 2 glycoside hydrolase [Melampsora larici-populina 98AG31]
MFQLLPLLALAASAAVQTVLSADTTRGPPLPNAHLDLSDLKWTLSNANKSISVPTSFVNQAHLALIDAGIIDDPNIGLNEGTTRWVGEEKAWLWQTNVDLSEIFKWEQVDQYFFAFQGLDTFCEIKLGPHLIGTTDNAFRSWVFNATDAIHKLGPSTHSTTLSLRFDSPWGVATRLAHEPGNLWYPQAGLGNPNVADTLVIYEYDARTHNASSYNGWLNRILFTFLGPAYLPSGPLKPGYLIGLARTATTETRPAAPRDPAHGDSQTVVTIKPPTTGQKDESDFEPYWIHKTVIDIYRQGQRNNLPPDQNAPWVINITLPLVTPHPPSRFASASLSGTLRGTNIKFAPVRLRALPLPAYSTDGPQVYLTASFSVAPNAVEKWYPATLGNPKLYELGLSFDSGFSPQTQWDERVGFRTIIVDQSQYTEQEVARGVTPGSKFNLQINGKPFFVQGSSIIPIDNFAARANSSTITWLLKSAVLAHQNVIRIWGGGAYETDEFYDLCDEIGVLAWSESVFACGAYPIEPKHILDNVLAETAENVQRLGRHPSVALWAGNNEPRITFADPKHLIQKGEGYIEWINGTWNNGSVYFKQYDYLYNHAIRDVLMDNTRSISYMPSSTTDGYLTLDPYVSRYGKHVPGEIDGDKELYNYNTAISFDTKNYPVARFVNEFGFHSMPSIYTWDRILTNIEAYSFNSSEIRVHTKHPPAKSLTYPFAADDGQKEMTTGVTDWYPTPNITGDPRELLAQWAYSTQVFQAAFMASEITYYRLGASRGENNMGALYWQLNDVWEGVSWSSIEYTGRWKIFHYVAERVQDHVIISPMFNRTNQTLDVYATSDLWYPVTGNAKWTWYDFAGKQLASANQTFSIGPINSTHLFRAVGLEDMVPGSTPSNDAWLHLQLTASSQTSGQSFYNEQFFHPVPLKDAALRASHVTVTVTGKNRFNIIGHGAVAAWVNVEPPPAILRDVFQLGVTGYFMDSRTKKPSNCFFLRPDEVRVLDFVVYEDNTNGEFSSKIHVRTLWDNYHKSNTPTTT